MKTTSGILRALALACVLCVSQVLAAQRAAEVVSVQGQAEARADEGAAWSPAVPRQELFASSYVRTGAYSRMGLLFADRTQVRLAEKTILQIKASAAAGERTTLRLESGRSWSQTNAVPANLYIETPSATAAVRGTDWEIEVLDGGRSLLTVLTGEVEFFNDFGRLTVARNEQAEAVPGRAPVKLLIANPRQRVQWVTAYSIDPRRHIDADAAAPAERERLERIAALVREQRLADAFPAAIEEISAGRATQPAAWLIASDLMVYQGRLDRADDYVRQGLARFPGEPRLIAQGARVSLAAGDFEGARQRLSPALAMPQPAFEARLAAADLARADGEGDAARAAYEAARVQRPGDDRPWYGLGVVDSERERVGSARANLNAALERNPQGVGYQGELGTLETLADRYGPAKGAFDAALARNASDYVALTGVGILDLKRGRPEAALDSFLKASTLEPRYARAHVYAGVASYQLGRQQLALRELARASELDDKDPLPHLYASMILTDLYRMAEAMQEARTAIALLPYLKSLNQVANDIQGSANLGRSVSIFGLEEWAQHRAQESYYPYWAGSHLFLSDRYPGQFNKNSALMQGFITDPTVFGASNRFQSLVPSPGNYGRALLGYAYAEDVNARIGVARANGLAYLGMPVAYLADFDTTNFRFTDPASQEGPSRTHAFTAAVGVRPLHDLGLFLYGFDTADNTTIRDPGTDFQQRLETSSANLGLHYGFTPTSQVWVRAGTLENRNEHDGILAGEPFASTTRSRVPEYQLRHTFDAGRHQLTWGVEQARKRLDFTFVSPAAADSGFDAFLTELNFRERSRDAYVSDVFDADTRLRLQADLWWQQSRRRMSDTFSGLSGGEVIALPPEVEDRGLTRAAPRLGVRYRFAGHALVRAAYQDWIRPMGTGTLGPVTTAGIPVDDRLLAAGGRLERTRVQVEAESSARTFWTLYADHKEIDNRRFSVSPFLISEDENLSKLRNFDFGSLASEDLYEFISAPEFDAGRIRIAGAAVNHVLTDVLSVRARYEYTDSRNTGASFAGNHIAFHPRHAALLAATYVTPRRLFFMTRATYRTLRYTDEGNLSPRQPGWDVATDLFWESRDKRQRLRFSTDHLLHKERHPLYTFVLTLSF
ncbi:MAG: FecR domain-containing protein [Betaproteobacteria bacterium]